MDTRAVLYFLNFLSREADNQEGLRELFKQAVNANDDVITLMSFVQDVSFFEGIGSSLGDRAKSLLDQLYRDPSSALSTLTQIRQLNETIQKELNLCTGLLRSPKAFSDSITVLRKKDRISYLKAYRQIASTCVYLIATYSGISSVKGLSWAETSGIQESVYAINTKFLPALGAVRKPLYSWVIKKGRLGGHALFDSEAFFLSYDEARTVEVECSSFHSEPQTTHCYLNVRAYEADELEVPYCWGTGNILSVSPADALLLTRQDVITKLRSPGPAELQRPVPTPIECARILSDGKPFCISPDELTNAMNQWIVGREIELRKARHSCLICGKQVSRDRLVCKSHFTSEMR